MNQPLSVYLAGSSDELDRVEHYMARLRKSGITITHDRTQSVRRTGGNPREASHEDRFAWMQADLLGIRDADMFWLLIPDQPSAGAWTEYGAALMSRCTVIVSGDWRRSIFTAGADHRFDSHDEAVVWLEEWISIETASAARGVFGW